MAQLIVRKLDDDAKERLKARAKRNGRSLEAEARAILEEAAGASATTAKKDKQRLRHSHARAIQGHRSHEVELAKFNRVIDKAVAN